MVASVDVIVVHADGARFGFRLDHVVEVFAAVATVPLPGAPSFVRGLVDVHGTLVPVIDLRARLGLPSRAPAPDDHVVTCLIAGRRVGVWVDRAEEVVRVPEQDLVPTAGGAVASFLPGVVRRADGLMLVYDVRAFLNADEALSLSSAMAAVGSGSRG